MKAPGSEVGIFVIPPLMDRIAGLDSSEYLLSQQLEQVSAVTIILHGCAASLHLIRSDVARAKSNLLGAGHHEPLPLFYGLDVERCLHQRFMSASVQPRH